MKSKNKLLYYEILGFILANLLMFILHDLYKNTGIPILSYISAVNESVYEHSKIAFFSLLIVYIIEYFIIGKEYNNYWFAKFVSLITAPILIIFLFYIYTGILGYNIFWVDIMIGIISLLVAQIISYIILSKDEDAPINNRFWLVLIIILAIILGYLTYNPIKIDLFKDNITGEYGITSE